MFLKKANKTCWWYRTFNEVIGNDPIKCQKWKDTNTTTTDCDGVLSTSSPNIGITMGARVCPVVLCSLICEHELVQICHKLCNTVPKGSPENLILFYWWLVRLTGHWDSNSEMKTHLLLASRATYKIGMSDEESKKWWKEKSECGMLERAQFAAHQGRGYGKLKGVGRQSWHGDVWQGKDVPNTGNGVYDATHSSEYIHRLGFCPTLGSYRYPSPCICHDPDITTHRTIFSFLYSPFLLFLPRLLLTPYDS